MIPYDYQLELDQLQEAAAASNTWAEFLLRAPAWAATLARSSLEESAEDEEEPVDFSEAFDLQRMSGFDEGACKFAINSAIGREKGVVVGSNLTILSIAELDTTCGCTASSTCLTRDNLHIKHAR